MKKLSIFFVSILFLIPAIAFGQLKIGYVDSNTILKELPDAQDAQKTIDALIQEWKDEIQKMERDLASKKTDFEKTKLIMSDTKRLQNETEISKLETDIANFRQSKFGFRGELYSQQEEIMKPVQNKIFSAIETVAEDEELDYVFDRSGDILFLYAKEEYDITALVLEILK
ncbi:MAG: OmpH family outer membrane protein [Bacteroidota bacterium]